MTCNGVIGRNAKLYIKDAETDTSATGIFATTQTLYDELATGVLYKEVCAVDVEYDGSKEKIDTSDRCSGDYKAYVPGQQEGTISFKAYKRKPITTGEWLDILRTAYQSNSNITALMLDGDRAVEGSDGVIANVNVFNLSETQSLNGPVEVSFELAVSGCVTYSPPAAPVTVPADPSP